MANGDGLVGVVESLLGLILACAEEREAVERVRFARENILRGGDLERALIILLRVLGLTLGDGPRSRGR